MNTRRWTMLALLTLLVATTGALAPGVVERARGEQAPAPADDTAPADTVPEADQASDDARAMRRELRDLAGAWADGGGTFGYPFWEKAGQRWRSRQITTAMYREYVTGYRDRLRAGCDLLEQVDTESDEAADVRALVLSSCTDRVDALRLQHRWLDTLIERDTAERDEADAEELAELDERSAELEAEWQQRLQASYRDARLAMEEAQARLDEAGMDRLREGAFI